MMTAKRTSVKTVQIIARYFIKKTGFVVYSVASSDGTATYCTTINAQGYATGCTCKSRVRCYHMNQLETREADRAQAIEPATVAVEAVMAAAQSAMVAFDHDLSANAYEVLAATKKVSRSCESCGGNHATSTCWL